MLGYKSLLLGSFLYVCTRVCVCVFALQIQAAYTYYMCGEREFGKMYDINLANNPAGCYLHNPNCPSYSGSF